MKKTCTILFTCLLAVMMCSCSANVTQSAETAAQGEAFNVGGDGYMLSEIVRLTDYDTNESIGYGVVILMESDTAPISFSKNSGDAVSSVQSLIGLTLDAENGGIYDYTDASFSLNEDSGNYKGKAVFKFSLPKDESFPQTGTFTYSGDPVEDIVLSFTGMELPVTVETTIETATAPATATAVEFLANNGVSVTSFEELKNAAMDTSTTKITIAADIEIAEDYTLERSDVLDIRVDEGISIIISGSFELVGCTLTDDGVITINGSFVYGISDFINNGVLDVQSGGTVSSGQSNAVNNGFVTIEQGGEFLVERGTIFDNAGELTNEGYISIQDGGQFNDQGGTVVNNGTIDLGSYYNGDITLIRGTGTLNDTRE
jgi:hypothetical protein